MTKKILSAGGFWEAVSAQAEFNHLSKVTLAELADVDRTQLYRRGNPTLQSALALCAALGLTLVVTDRPSMIDAYM